MAAVGPHVDRVYAKGPRPSMTSHIKVARQQAEDDADVTVMAVSVFVGGPRSRTITLHRDEATELNEYISQTGIRVVAHNVYTASPWHGDPSAAEFIRKELRICQAAGIAGLVVHLPKLPAERTMRYIARLLEPEAPNVRIYLETPAVRARESYYETPAKLADLFRRIRDSLDPELCLFGLCFDTAHLWTCGIDVQSYAAAASWLTDLELASDIIPHDHIMCHLNDSYRPLGVGPDVHAPLAAGQIWGMYREDIGRSGLAAFADYSQRHDTVMILERKPPEALLNDYKVLRGLIPGISRR